MGGPEMPPPPAARKPPTSPGGSSIGFGGLGGLLLVYPHQAERLTAALERGGLDALVAASPENVAYVTGFWSLSRAVYPATEIYAVVARTGTALVVPTIDALAATEGAIDASSVFPYGRFVLDPGARPRELAEP